MLFAALLLKSSVALVRDSASRLVPKLAASHVFPDAVSAPAVAFARLSERITAPLACVESNKAPHTRNLEIGTFDLFLSKA